MTPEQEKQKARIKVAEKELRDAHAAHECVVEPATPGETDGFAICPICRHVFGWWCPNSPDHLCDYEPPGNPDNCNYCHEPDERKWGIMWKFATILLLLVACDKKESCCQPGAVLASKVERAKDPVCKMWVEKNRPNYQDVMIMFDNTKFYFCCDECAIQFTKNPTKFVTPCSCSKTGRDCKCDHCQGKQVPCDCYE